MMRVFARSAAEAVGMEVVRAVQKLRRSCIVMGWEGRVESVCGYPCGSVYNTVLLHLMGFIS